MQDYQFAPPPQNNKQHPRVGVPRQPHGGIVQPGQPALQPVQPMTQTAPAQGQTFCHDCGQPVEPGSAVCVHCNYILDPEAFKQAQRLFRRRREAEQRRRAAGMMPRGGVSPNGMPPLEPSGRAQQPAAADVTPEQVVRAGPRYHYETIGSVFCPSCGTEVQEGACQCVSCGYVLDAVQYAMTQQQVQRQLAVRENREAKLSRSDLIKSLLIPRYGRKMYKANIQNRPQIANPCRKAGRFNTFLIILLIILFFGLF